MSSADKKTCPHCGQVIPEPLPVFPITPEDFENLPEYSLSLPTDPSVGRIWKTMRGSQENVKWFIGKVEQDSKGDRVIRWYKPEITTLQKLMEERDAARARVAELESNPS